jgi:two-component system, OmpR family, sensor histidine kinase MtrB
MLRLSLRWRVAVAFGLAFLLLTGVLAASTWSLASGYMIRQRDLSTTRQAEVNVRLVDRLLRAGDEDLGDVLTGMTRNSESTVLIERPDGWITSGRQIDADTLPQPLVELARDGVPARQRLVVERVPVQAVALPVAGDGVYVELFPLSELDRTFRFLSSVLVTGAAVSALLGFVLGWWASRRALRPLTELGKAASRVARGDLHARLPDQDDPDLAPLAQTFNRSVKELEERVKRDARFASDVSHELRSPLTTMANAAQVLRRRRDELSGTADRALELLLAEVDRFQVMVVDLLEITRHDQQPDEGDMEAVDLGDLVNNVVAVRPGRHPVTELERPPPIVRGDRRRLDRIVTNLLDNADKYGGGAVRVGVLRRDGHGRIEVDDAGPGVPESDRGEIFERFARGSWARRRGDNPGIGLGLALVAQHVRRHGGRVWVEDRPGGGARFVVELPEVD